MKFAVMVVVCCVAFAAANDEEPTAEQLEGLKKFFDMAVAELKASCKNHKPTCNDYMSKRFSDASQEKEKKHFTEACVVLMGQYLCHEETKSGEGFADLYKQAKKFVEQA